MHRKLVSRTCEGYLRCSSFVAAAAAAARGSACSSLTIRVLVPKYTSQTDAYVVRTCSKRRSYKVGDCVYKSPTEGCFHILSRGWNDRTNEQALFWALIWKRNLDRKKDTLVLVKGDKRSVKFPWQGVWTSLPVPVPRGVDFAGFSWWK